MNPKLSKALQIILPLGLGIFLIWYSYNKFTPEELITIKENFKSANYGWVLLSIVFALLSHFSRAYRWNYMLEPLGYRPKVPNNIMAVGIAYLMNMFIPRSGEVSRALVVKKYEGVPFDKAFGTIIAERVADLVILGALVLIALLSQFDILSAYIIDSLPQEKLIFALVSLVVFVVVTILFFRYSNNAISKKIKTFLIGIKEGIFSILKMKNKWGFIFHTIFIWVMYLLMFYVCIFALPETSHINFPILISAFVVGSFTIAFTNGGVGWYPFVIGKILLLYGIAETDGAAFGWIVWTAQFIMILIFGGVSFLILPFYNRKNKQKNES
ncbi:lysylphosphatidylglycerol synthase transmembrane domain-containing protein [Spongiivirga citrea]|uniref:Flippase-like domain-containing protein n=1 Tax=Spongiivirga citrea TaxID=1481457 RepID=A0A6M0CNP9_9FLAO|nr:lysylphosphatidylglycerol synthase transmembrane domain-containing protein [Spongiivirga citrea]NER17097.1 flippase-like domain-containing protein [Spongiivirga citrea]